MKNFSNIEESVRINRGKLQCHQDQLQIIPLDINLQHEEKFMAAKFQRTTYLTESLLLQKTKVLWIRKGHCNLSPKFKMRINSGNVNLHKLQGFCDVLYQFAWYLFRGMEEHSSSYIFPRLKVVNRAMMCF